MGSKCEKYSRNLQQKHIDNYLYKISKLHIYSKQLNIDILNLNCMFGVWLSASTSSHVWLHYIRTKMFLNILFLLKKN